MVSVADPASPHVPGRVSGEPSRSREKLVAAENGPRTAMCKSSPTTIMRGIARLRALRPCGPARPEVAWKEEGKSRACPLQPCLHRNPSNGRDRLGPISRTGRFLANAELSLLRSPARTGDGAGGSGDLRHPASPGKDPGHSAQGIPG